MRLSKLFLPTLKEVPSDADTISQVLMIRAGMIRKLASGIYEWLPLGLRVLKKVEQIVREEMNAVGGQEVWLPLLLPRELWDETGRWQVYGKELFRLKDRKDADFCLGPTHEEVITDIVRKEVRSYRELPLMLYQFGIKFRDEIRPRFGVMRGREFYMKDAYSFHSTEQDAEDYYVKVFNAYDKICRRCGFKFRAVEAESGAIGGSFSHEFMVLADTGEEEIVSCECGYAANVERAETGTNPKSPSDLLRAGKVQSPKSEIGNWKLEIGNLEEVYTPNLRTVEEVSNFLKATPDKFIKSLIYLADSNPVMVLVRGDYEINESKLNRQLKCNELVLADTETIQKVSGAAVGFAGPVGLKQNIKIVADYTVADMVNAISGANKTDYHLKNINLNRDFQVDVIADLHKAKRGDICAHCGKELQFSRGIEVGHTFKLGTKYSKSLKATFLDAEGKEQLFIMGCYGIGVSRIVAASIEQLYDNNGIIWPMALAPYQVIIIPINYANEKQRETVERLYIDLREMGIEVLIDDRNERPGMKFKDADLIGIPIRITVSDKTLAENKVELKLRNENSSSLVALDEIIKKVELCLSDSMKR